MIHYMTLGAVLAAFAAQAGEIDLSKIEVVRARKENAQQKVAADDLVKHLKLICGSEEGVGGFRFVFARPADEPTAQPFTAHAKRVGNAIWFWGDDKGVRRYPCYGSSFAVSQFLEKSLGVRWVSPGDDGIVWREGVKPTLADDWRWDWTYPSYVSLMRGIDADWGRRNGYFEKRPFPYRHAFCDWQKKYLKDHPEYFGLNPYGKRGLPEYHAKLVKLCLSNPAVIDRILGNWQEAGTNAFINVCPNDGTPGYCFCENCRALDADLPGENFYVHKTDRYFNFWNRLVGRAREIRPDVKVATYVYSYYRFPPRRERIVYPDNMIFGWVPCQADDFSGNLAKLREAGMKHFFLRPNFHHYLGSIPRGMEKVLFDNFRQCLEFGMVGVDYDAPATRHIMNIEYYVSARMVADPKGSFDDFCRDFYMGFGPAADDMRAYFELVRRHGEAARDEFMRVRFGNIRIIDDSELSILQCFGRTEEGLREEFALVDAAAKKWAGKIPKTYADRIEEVRVRAEHAILTYRYLTLQNDNDKTEFIRRGEELVAYRIARKDAMPDNWTAVFGDWTGEIRTWRRNVPYSIVSCDGGELDPRGVQYGWSINFEGMGFGRWRSGDNYAYVTNDVASKGEWSCRLAADRESSTRNDNLGVLPGRKYRITADLLAEPGAEGARMRVYAYPAPEKGYEGGNLVCERFADLPVGKWAERSVEFTAPTKFPDERKKKYGPLYYENVVPHVQALGGKPGSALHVDNIRVRLIEE